MSVKALDHASRGESNLALASVVQSKSSLERTERRVDEEWTDEVRPVAHGSDTNLGVGDTPYRLDNFVKPDNADNACDGGSKPDGNESRDRKRERRMWVARATSANQEGCEAEAKREVILAERMSGRGTAIA